MPESHQPAAIQAEIDATKAARRLWLERGEAVVSPDMGKPDKRWPSRDTWQVLFSGLGVLVAIIALAVQIKQ
ncbi:hypothetical protein [Streptomyces hydrogenans]|uniref:hypothetical protein n=1 Tax=Streptomyces hydrogenans TaxID=1873719 RepID=UPI0035E205A3